MPVGRPRGYTISQVIPQRTTFRNTYVIRWESELENVIDPIHRKSEYYSFERYRYKGKNYQLGESNDDRRCVNMSKVYLPVCMPSIFQKKKKSNDVIIGRHGF